jgi:TetR/AcrR family transcriptional regulator
LQTTQNYSGRGRPVKSDVQHEEVRRRIIEATRKVFIAVGYHGLSVELILTQCALSRPTFYKYFRNTDEPIEVVLREANDQLIHDMTQAVSRADGLFAQIEIALLAWRKWGDDMGSLLRPLFGELHDRHSPAWHYRLRTLKVIENNLIQAAVLAGMPRPSRILIQALINGVEFLGYRFQLETPKDEVSWQQTRSAMLRMALGLLASEQQLGEAVGLALKLGIDLNPSESAL